jgi:glucokinase
MHSAPPPPIIALDVGGSSVKSAALREKNRPLHPPATSPIDSQADAEEILERFVAIIEAHRKELGAPARVSIAFAFPGPFEYEQGISRIRGVEKFESLYGLNIGTEIKRRLPHCALQIRFRNDAEAAILGEALFGAGRGARKILGVTLGTGFGCAFVEDGRALPETPKTPALYPLPARDARADDVFSIRGVKRALAAAGFDDLDIAIAAERAAKGNAVLRQVFSEFGADLGAFLAPWARSFAADLVLIQGGIAGAFDLFAGPLQAALPVPARCGEMGALAALLGAAALFATSPAR